MVATVVISMIPISSLLPNCSDHYFIYPHLPFLNVLHVPLIVFALHYSCCSVSAADTRMSRSTSKGTNLTP